MGLPFFGIILIVFLFVLAMGAVTFFATRKSRSGLAGNPPPVETPAGRLADQWLAESLRQLETVPQAGPAPLNEAAHELLELRLEAGRVGEGVKSLRLARQALREGSAAPLPPGDLARVAAELLGPGDYRPGDSPEALWLVTAMGEIPVLTLSPSHSNEAACRSKVQELARMASGHAANPLAGGLLYIPEEVLYERYAGTGGEVADLLRDRRILPVDPRGLVALLTALRLNRKAQRVWESLGEAIQSVAPLAGHTARLEKELGALNSDSLRTRIQFERKN